MRAVFAIPGDLAALTGGYAYDREVMARAPAFGVDFAPLALPQGFPAPSAAELRETQRRLRGLSGDEALLIDGAYKAPPKLSTDQLRANAGFEPLSEVLKSKHGKVLH